MTDPWVPWALGVVLALIVAFVVALVAGEREAGVGGRHHWIEPADLEPDDLPAREVQHAPGTCTAEEAGDYEVCEDRQPGEGVTSLDRVE